MTGRDLLLGSSFQFTTQATDSADGRWSGWGQAAPLRFSEASGGRGEGAIGLFGTDYGQGRPLAGVALSYGAG